MPEVWRPSLHIWAAAILTWALLIWLLGPSASFDRGGSVAAYAARAESYTGPLPMTCMSACTLYLRHGCVTPDHRLTFHGPSLGGEPLTQGAFDYWSRVMAGHYPPALASWFMATARHGEHTITGAEAIRHGARACI